MIWIGCGIRDSKDWIGLKAQGAAFIKAGVASGNVASIALLEKLNFQYYDTDNEELIFILRLDQEVIC